jgi:hypothetical protein
MMVVAAILLATPLSSPALAQQAPRANCVAVTKQEYNNARKTKLQRHRFGEYLRTGRVLKRFYWFCPA